MQNDPLRPKPDPNVYLGFDYGTRNIGVAVGRRDTSMAMPLETVCAIKERTNWPAISRLVEEWQPAGIVVGLSRQEDGSENSVTQPILKFCRQLKGRYGLPVFQVDEFLSTRASRQLLYDDLNLGRKKLLAVQDRVAAQLILQSWFESTRLRAGTDDPS